MTAQLIEENGQYAFNCQKALWATDALHQAYHAAGLHSLKDVDFLIESDQALLMVEYKNASIPGAAHPEAFDPMRERMVNSLVHKFYDSLPYLALLNKTKPRQYIIVIEYPHSDAVTRRRLEDRIHQQMPFRLQASFGTGRPLLDGLKVLSIDEWNRDDVYGQYPIEKASV